MTYEAPQDPFVTSSHPHTPVRRPKTSVVFLLALAVAVVGVVGAVFAPKVLDALGDSDAVATFDVTGDLVVTGAGLKYGASTGDCVGDGGYSDITGSTSVVVTDAKGTTVAVGSLLGEGKARRDTVSPIKPTSCTFTFKATGVPEGSQFYGITVGKRGTQQYAREQLNAPIHLTLG